MLDVDKNYWFYLESYVYCKVMDTKSLLYNTLHGTRIVVSSDIVNSLIKEIHKDENYGSILIDVEMLSNNIVVSFIREVIDNFFGKVIIVDYKTKKPIKPLPIFRLDNDVERAIERGDKYTGKNVLENLLTVNLYVNDTCNTGCSGCDAYFKQVTCCSVRLGKQSILSKDQVDSVVSQIEKLDVGHVNILGGNIFKYTDLSYLVSKIETSGIEVSIWTHYSHLQDSLSLKVPYLNIIVPTLFIESELVNVIRSIRNSRTKYHFFVEEDSDIENCETFILKFKVNNYQLHPIFNGNNLVFFEKNVFIDKDDIFQKKYSNREIFAHQKINTNYFGVLTIYSNGDVVADNNSTILGNIDSHNIVELVHKELLQNTAWRRLRDKEPCLSCLNQFFCPSPSGYEIAIGKNNLCYAFE